MTVHDDAGAAKQALRTRLLAARRDRPAEVLAEARSALARLVLGVADVSGWRLVAAYEPMRTEPGSVELLTGLRRSGVRVLVPVTLPDNDLDWRAWGSDQTEGTEAIGGCDAVLSPALAVDRSGGRLGRGGGSYDRALQRAARAVRVALVFDDEVLDHVPTEPWDQPVDAAATPSGWVSFGADGGSAATSGNGRVARDR